MQNATQMLYLQNQNKNKRKTILREDLDKEFNLGKEYMRMMKQLNTQNKPLYDTL